MGTSEDKGVKKSTSNLTTEFFQLKVSIKGDLGALAGLFTGNRYMEATKKLVHGMEEEAGKENFQLAETFYKKSFLEYKELMGKIIANTPVKVEDNSMVDQAATRQAFGGAAARDWKQPVKIKSMECPKWYGRYQTFVRFKKSWEKNIQSRHEDSAQHYLFCQILTEESSGQHLYVVQLSSRHLVIFRPEIWKI